MITASGTFTTRNAARSKQPIHVIQIAGYHRVFLNQHVNVIGSTTWLVGVDDYSMTISELDGGSDLGELTFTIQDRKAAITGDFPNFVFEGKAITLKTGFSGMDLADFVTLFTGEIESVDSANQNNDYLFTCTDNKQKLTQVIFTEGSSGLPTDSDNPLEVEGHFLDILLGILTEEIGYANSLVDFDTIIAYRDGVFSGLNTLFKITSPPQAMDFIENELLKPFGGYIFTNNNGRLSVNFIYPLTTESVGSLTRDHIIGIPEAKQIDLINTLSYRFDKVDDNAQTTDEDQVPSDNDGFASESVQTFDKSITRYGQYGSQVVESQGVRSEFQGYLIAALVSRLIFLRYGLKALMFEELEVIWSRLKFEAGDLITITHDLVPDRALGVMGIADKKFIVFDKSYNFKTAVVTYRVLDAQEIANFAKFLITTDEQANFTDSTDEEKSTLMFLSGDDGKYSDESEGNTLG